MTQAEGNRMALYLRLVAQGVIATFHVPGSRLQFGTLGERIVYAKDVLVPALPRSVQVRAIEEVGRLPAMLILEVRRPAAQGVGQVDANGP